MFSSIRGGLPQSKFFIGGGKAWKTAVEVCPMKACLEASIPCAAADPLSLMGGG